MISKLYFQKLIHFGFIFSSTVVFSQSVSNQLNLTSTVKNCCYGQSNGSIDLSVSGGTSPYTYNWKSGQTTEDISGLKQGKFSVTVTDSKGSKGVLLVSVSSFSKISATIAIANVKCYGDNTGVLDLSVSGGTSPYSYLWSDGKTTEDNYNLSAGSYSVGVTDYYGCTASKSVTINEPSALDISGQVKDYSCSTSGGINLSVHGGVSPYTYKWSNGEITEDISNLIAGNYSVVVTDSNSCSETQTYTVAEKDPFTVNGPITYPSCETCNDGVIVCVPTGGAYPYSWQWSNGDTGKFIFNLSPGTYIVLITDANGCSMTYTYELTASSNKTASIIMKDVDGDMTNRISLFPNPSQGEVWLKLQNNTSSTFALFVYDIQGRLVVSKQNFKYSASGTLISEFEHLPDNFYWIKLFSENESYKIPLIKYKSE
jgi:hypothetical protein